MSGNQLHTYVMVRLNQCVDWMRSNAWPGPKRVRSWWGPMVLDRNVKRTADPDRPAVVNDSEAEETLRCIMAIEDSDLRSAVIEAYFEGGTVDQKVNALGCCRKTYYNRLERAYTEILGYMNDIAAGLPLPVRKSADSKDVDLVTLF